MRIPIEWELPPPPKGPENVWKVYISPFKKVPWGYFQDPDDPYVMHPIPKELDLLEKAKLYLKEYSYEEVSEWLSRESGRKISKLGLWKRVRSERRSKKAAEQARWYQKKAEEFAAKAEKYENNLGGVGLRDINHPKDCACGTCSRNPNRR